jgi:hypothetical protein
LLATVVALRLLGLKRWQATLARWTRTAARGERTIPSAAIREAPRLVHAAARRIVGADCCLPESLVLWALLRRRGLNPQLRLGVRRCDARLQAHAWVEHEGLPLNDGRNAAFVAFGQTIVPSGFQAA